MVTYPRPHWRQQSLHGWFGWFRWARVPSAVSVYYPSPQIDPVRNAVSSSERTSPLQRSSLPTQRARRTDRHTEREPVCVCVHIGTHTVGSRRREGSAKLPVLLLLPPTCQLVCDLPLWSTVVLMYNGRSLSPFSLSLPSRSPSLSLPVPFSLTLPHCLQLHLFPSMWQMIAGLFFMVQLSC